MTRAGALPVRQRFEQEARSKGARSTRALGASAGGAVVIVDGDGATYYVTPWHELIPAEKLSSAEAAVEALLGIDAAGRVYARGATADGDEVFALVPVFE
jgi:hypothetical protein